MATTCQWIYQWHQTLSQRHTLHKPAPESGVEFMAPISGAGFCSVCRPTRLNISPLFSWQINPRYYWQSCVACLKLELYKHVLSLASHMFWTLRYYLRCVCAYGNRTYVDLTELDNANGSINGENTGSGGHFFKWGSKNTFWPPLLSCTKHVFAAIGSLSCTINAINSVHYSHTEWYVRTSYNLCVECHSGAVIFHSQKTENIHQINTERKPSHESISATCRPRSYWQNGP